MRLFLAAFGLVLAAQPPDYFPLDVGNVWIYKLRGRPAIAGQDTVTVEVTGAEPINGQTWFRLRDYLGGEFFVRQTPAGQVLQLDEKTGEEKLWYDFARTKGETYATGLPACCGRAAVKDTAGSKRVTLGQFENALYQLTYPGVFQVGLVEENFFPYVGLIHREQNTGGPSMRTQDLVYARISGVTVLNAEGGLVFGLSRGAGYVRLSLVNSTGQPARVVFLSGQTFDVTVRVAGGAELYRWSAGKGFTSALRPVIFPPGETSWVVPLPPIAETVAGPFVIEASLATIGGQFQATVPY